MLWAEHGGQTLLRVFVPPMKPSIAVTMSGIPEGRAARVSWLLPGDYRKAARPSEMANGVHRLELSWRSSTRLRDALLVIEVWCPNGPLPAPTVQVEALAPERLTPHLNRCRFSQGLLLEVARLRHLEPRPGQVPVSVPGEPKRR